MRKMKSTKLHIKGPRSGHGVTVILDKMKFEDALVQSWSATYDMQPVYEGGVLVGFEYPRTALINVSFQTKVGTPISVEGDKVDFCWEE